MEEIKVKINSMSQDLDPSVVLGTIAFENMNLRFSPTEDGQSLLSITNEKGTESIPVVESSKRTRQVNIPGIVLGYAVILDYLVLFTIDTDSETNYIVLLTKGYYRHPTSRESIEALVITSLILSDFNFSISSPIETLVSVEREDILKVYWVDGINPLRMLIILDIIELNGKENLSTEYFDAIRSIEPPTITITELTSGGTFPAGVLQYACTYYSSYKGESNICYLSPLLYISNEFGVASDKTCSTSFKLNISSVDDSYEYLRVYSIIRTGINGTPLVKLVNDISINDIGSSQEHVTTYDVDVYNKSVIMVESDLTIWVLHLYTTSEGETVTNTTQLSGVLEITITPKKNASNTLGVYYRLGEAFQQQLFFEENITTNYIVSLSKKVGSTLGLYTIKHAVESTKSNFEYIDNGLYGSEWEAQKLLYVGGERFIPNCIALKDDTLFLGNFSLSRLEPSGITIPESSFNFFIDNEASRNRKVQITTRVNESGITDSTKLKYYSYTGLLLNSNSNITTFKAGETYRIGILFLDKYGRWSNPKFITDEEQSIYLNSETTVLSAEYCYEPSVYLVSGKLTLTNDIVEKLLELGYIKARPLIVYPQEAERKVLFLGVANCTLKRATLGIYNTEEEGAVEKTYSDTLEFEYRIPSWFYRPLIVNTISAEKKNWGKEYALWTNQKRPELQYEHGKIIPCYYNSESGGTPSCHKNNLLAEFLCQTDDNFIIDWSTITVDSPDLKFNEQLANIDLSDVKVRIVGYTKQYARSQCCYLNIDGSYEVPESYINVKDPSNLPDNYYTGLPLGDSIKFNYNWFSYSGSKDAVLGTTINFPFWIDAASDKGPSGAKVHDKLVASWYVFPWNRNGALNNCPSASVGNLAKVPETLKQKIWSNLRYTVNTKYFSRPININSGAVVGSKNAKVFLYESAQLTTRFDNGDVYRNAIDTLLPSHGYPPYAFSGQVTCSDGKGYIRFMTSQSSAQEFPETISTEFTSSNLIKNMYNSSSGTRHFAYFDINSDGWTPTNYDDVKSLISTLPIPLSFKTGNTCVIKLGANLLDSFSNYEGFPIVEVYRDVELFGGTSDTALQNNEWTIAGDIVDLTKGNSTILYYTLGDTYYQRFDSLKTLPYNDTSVNSIVEILSFMCETHINIDGRYDNNRGLLDNTTITNENFNLINPVYSLLNNYFSYNILPSDLLSVNNYPTLITWPLTKVNGSAVDNWLNNTLTSYVNLDGDKGKVSAIKLFKDNLFIFLDKGISLLKFNQNVLLNSEAGVPIEIANSSKVTGFLYIETTSGCYDKWAITETPEYLAYIDHYNKSFNLLSNLGRTDLSSSLGMYSWFRKNIENSCWTPDYINNSCKLLFSAKNNEVLITNDSYSLAYNLTNKAFTSFYSYNHVPWLVNYNGKEILITNSSDGDSPISLFWGLNSGKYNSFFGEVLPYYTRFIANTAEKFDDIKVFSNLEIRDNIPTDYDSTTKSLKRLAFNLISVKDSYLDSGDVELSYIKNRPSILKSKFRVWRINIPRDSTNKRDRMTDHYLDITLTYNKEEESDTVTKIHDMKVLYI